MANTLSNIKGILLDINGVLHVDNQPLDGAVETIKKIQAKLPCRFITRGKTSEDTVGESNLIVILRNPKKEN